MNNRLHRACIEGNLELVRMYINDDGNAYINEKDKLGFTPLHYACRHGNIECVKVLILNGANINIKNKHGDTPLQFFRFAKELLF